MVFDIFAVLFLTFFSALGMVTLSNWLLSHSYGKRFRRKIFVIAEVDSLPVNDLEDGLRRLLAETDLSDRYLVLDGRDASPEASALCRNLEKRFNCLFFSDEKELCSFLVSSLHSEIKEV